MPSLPYWLLPGDDRPPGEIDDEITEELQLHLDLLAEARMRQGVAPEQARRAAAERFGDFSSLVRRCRREKQGDAAMLKRVQAVLIGVLVLFVGLLCWRDYVNGSAIAQYQTQTTKFLVTIQSDLAELRGELQLAEEVSRAANKTAYFQPGDIDVDGVISPGVEWPSTENSLNEQASGRYFVCDAYAEPIPGSQVHLYRGGDNADVNTLVKHITANADSDGRVVWSCAGSGIAIATADGYAACSSSFAGVAHDVEETLILDKANPFELRVTNGNGEPARFLSVVPHRRTDRRDSSHEYPLGDREFWSRTDEEGRTTIDWLAADDLVTMLLKERGKPIDSAIRVEFEVPNAPSKTVVISLDESAHVDSFGGGYGGFGGEYNPPARYSVRVVNKQSSESSVTWTPPDNPDPNLIRREAQADAKAKRYEVALAKHVWYHENATSIEPSLSAVRLSFALSEWYDLGCVYPPAMEKLTSIRDALEQRIGDGEDLGAKFHDLAAINKTLNEPGRTVASFRTLDSQNRRAARRAFHFARDALIAERAFDLYNEYTDSETEYERLEEMIDRAPDDDRVADTLKRLFRDRVVELVAVLVTTEKPTEAVKIAELARAKDDDTTFLEELDAALRDGLPVR